ncbi:MAG: AMP-binding protein [Magnetococcales bacterium]|nr:AMP-binding protein [Magnetococcales bacterium]
MKARIISAIGRQIARLFWHTKPLSDRYQTSQGQLFVVTGHFPTKLNAWAFFSLFSSSCKIFPPPDHHLKNLFFSFEKPIYEISAKQLERLSNHLINGGDIVVFPETVPPQNPTAIKTLAWPMQLAKKCGINPQVLCTPLPDRLLQPHFTQNRLSICSGHIYSYKILLPEFSVRTSTTTYALALGYAISEARTQAQLSKPVNLWKKLTQTAQTHDPTKPVISDSLGLSFTLRSTLFRSQLIGRMIDDVVADTEKNIGIMLPTGTVNVLALFGTLSINKTPALINFTAGAGPIRAGCATAQIRTIFTSKKFIRKAGLTDLITQLTDNSHDFPNPPVEILYLEEMRKNVKPWWLIPSFINARFPALASRLCTANAQQTAAILFTSGSEGAPKAVPLTHHNLLSNVAQNTAHVPFTPQDKLFNALPLFHCFGLTVNLLVPLFNAIPSYMHPSPLEYRKIATLCMREGCTIIAGTDTFLNAWGRVAHPVDFQTIRLAISGAEPLKSETRDLWANRFGLRILEGYGATETSPVISVNTPVLFKQGSVGRFLPGIAYKIKPISGIETGGQLLVAGANVMPGYLDAEKPGKTLPLNSDLPNSRWYDTGDIVHVDAEGFVFIQGRAKRFAKIGGEMVSLAAVERIASSVWPDHNHVAVRLPDPRKGEKIVLLTEHPNPQRTLLMKKTREMGLSELHIAKNLQTIEKLPLTGTGKIDYAAVDTLVNKTA